ncbi:MAG: hypothetical protein KC619_24670 [Myxococcales bacterium]|nr:hypothetical protein [Myxococcales bacterium]
MSSEPDRWTPELVYERWAPEGGPWSPWVKPVLFTEIREARLPELPALVGRVDVSWAPDPMVEEVEEQTGYRDAPVRERVAASDRAAIVVDVPGAHGAALGVALIARGYRPVPLYNGVAGGRTGYRATDIAQVIAAGTRRLADGPLPLDAPPAFLLDRDRLKGNPRPGDFDGRWIVFPQDFPSANALKQRGITQVVLKGDGRPVAEDLAHVLLDWRRGGLPLLHAVAGQPLAPVEVAEPPSYRSLLRRASVLLGLRRSAGGGFGALVPVPSQGGG